MRCLIFSLIYNTYNDDAIYANLVNWPFWKWKTWHCLCVWVCFSLNQLYAKGTLAGGKVRYGMARKGNSIRKRSRLQTIGSIIYQPYIPPFFFLHVLLIHIHPVPILSLHTYLSFFKSWKYSYSFVRYQGTIRVIVFHLNKFNLPFVENHYHGLSPFFAHFIPLG